MPDQEIAAYVREQRDRSVADDMIRTNLLGIGWQAQDIDSALAETPRPATPQAGIPPQGLAPEELRVVRSWSSGAFVPFLYSASMRLWPFLAAELAVLLLPAALAFLPSLKAGGSLSLLGGLFLWTVFLPLASLLVLILRMVLGKRLAWRSRRWRDFGHFLSVQRRWDVAGRVTLIVAVLPGLVAAAAIFLTAGLDNSSANPSASPAAASPNPGVPTASAGPVTSSGADVILGKSNGGYASLAQLIVSPSIPKIDGITLASAGTLPPAPYQMDASLVGARSDTDPDGFDKLGSASIWTSPQPTVGEIAGGSALSGSAPLGLSFTDLLANSGGEPGRSFLVLTQPTDETNFPNGTGSAVELGLRPAAAGEVLLGSYVPAQQAWSNLDDGSEWHVISGKALDMSIR